jgi:hypothetical protein
VLGAAAMMSHALPAVVVLSAAALAMIGCGGSVDETLVSDAASETSADTRVAIDSRASDVLPDTATTDSDAKPCDYPPVVNDPECPGSYSHTYNGERCSRPGVRCSYPGAGDIQTGGCAATAVLYCIARDSGFDAGEAGYPYWVAMQ